MNYCFQKANSDNKHEIFLYDDITKYGEFNWETWEYDESETSAKHFKGLLDEIPETDEIELHINSNGGSVSEGTTIYNLLRQHGAKKTGIVDGVCHSIAFTILQACDTRIMGDGTSAIIHNMWTQVSGNAQELRKAADNLDKFMESCIQLYMKRCTISEEELRAKMDTETVLTPQDALNYGLIDQIGVKAEEATEQQLMQLEQENKKLRQQIKNDDFMKQQLSDFLQSVKDKPMENKIKEKQPKQKSTGLDAFFSGKKGE